MTSEPPRADYRLQSLRRLVDQLQASRREMSDRAFNPLEQSGYVKQFELAAELAWKLLADMLREGGTIVGGSPKAVVRAAFAEGLIIDGQGWIDLIDARNETSHIYDQSKLGAWIDQIQKVYLPLLVTLRDAADGDGGA